MRLGLVLSEIGPAQRDQVTQDELNRAVFNEARRYPGQEQQVSSSSRKQPQAIEGLRAPIYEDKVVDFILEKAKVEDRPVSVEELMRDPDEEPATEGGESEEKPGRKAASKKGAGAKKAAPKKGAAEAPAEEATVQPAKKAGAKSKKAAGTEDADAAGETGDES